MRFLTILHGKRVYLLCIALVRLVFVCVVGDFVCMLDGVVCIFSDEAMTKTRTNRRTENEWRNQYPDVSFIDSKSLHFRAFNANV